MRLSKKGAAIQRAIHDAIASGKALGGLLVGLATVAVAGCRDNNSSAHTMGRFPDPRYQDNATRESCGRRAIPGEPPVPQPEETNVVNECRAIKPGRTLGVPPRSDKDNSK